MSRCLKSGGRPRPVACLVMRSVLSRYPSSAFQAAILEENGFQVVVCDIDDGGYDTKLIPSGAERRVLERVSDLFAGNRASSLKKILGRQRFHSRLKAVLDELRPHLVISYDPPAFATMTRIIKSGRVPKFMHIWHCHELAEISDDMGWGTRRDHLRTKVAADLADLAVIPDRERAAAYFSEYAFKEPPYIVMNCPRRLDKPPASTMAELLKGTSAPYEETQTVLYLGSVGEGHGLESAVAGMKYWPRESCFVIVGPYPEAYRAKLLALAKSVGVQDRVILTGPVDAGQAWGIRVGATIALTLMDITQPAYRYCAGASNKRFEAMAAGVAQVTNEGPGIDEIFVQPGVALAVPYDDPDAMGRAVASLLGNPQQRHAMARRARSLHLEKYYYELEFKPVLARIMDFVRSKAPGGC